MPGCRALTASYYGGGFVGRPTASGAIYTGRGMTAAHRTLPFGTKVRIKNVRNGKTVEVTITDRGPYYAGRAYDLSPAARAAIGGGGLTCVNAEVLGRGGRVASR
jgi:rare lipoprotein A